MEDSHPGDHDRQVAQVVNVLANHEKQLMNRARRLDGLSKGGFQDADDLYQETVCQILSHLSVPGAMAIANPFGYALQVMRHLWIDQRVKANKVLMESLDAMQEDPTRQGDIPTVEPEVLRIAKNNELMEELNNLRGALTGDERRLLKARFKGETLEEIAASCNEDIFRTRARWYQLKAKLLRLLRNGNGHTKTPGRA